MMKNKKRPSRAELMTEAAFDYSMDWIESCIMASPSDSDAEIDIVEETAEHSPRGYRLALFRMIRATPGGVSRRIILH